MTDLAIRTEGLTKRYGKTEALRGLDLSVPRGAIYGFLGRNGAGKTTTIKSLLGLVRPDRGTASVLGYGIGREPLDILQRVAFVSETKVLIDELTAAELARYNRGFYPTWSDELASRYARVFEIPMDRPFGKLSLGNRTKVCLLLALAQRAELLILDEPTSGLDPVAIDQLLRVLVEDHAAEGRTVFFSSHQLAQVQKISDWVGIIDAGRLLLQVRLDDMRADFRVIHASGTSGAAELEDAEILMRRRSETFYRYLVSGNAELVAARLRQRGMTVLEIAPVALEDAFLGLVAKEQPSEVMA